MILGIAVATMEQPSINHYPGDIDGWCELMSAKTRDRALIAIQYNTPEKNLGVVGSYQKLYEHMSACDVIVFIHDDVICRERNWDERVLKEFEDPAVGVLGFGGAYWHGTPELYKVPYVLNNLRRGDYRSNVDDAEVHGERFTEACDVAVLDGFSLVVRRDLLDRANGLYSIASGCDFFCYDYALCAMARRYGYRIRCVGIRCHHRGGGTSVLAKTGIASPEAYEASHRWFYDEFKDVMPARV